MTFPGFPWLDTPWYMIITVLTMIVGVKCTPVNNYSCTDSPYHIYLTRILHKIDRKNYPKFKNEGCLSSLLFLWWNTHYICSYSHNKVFILRFIVHCCLWTSWQTAPISRHSLFTKFLFFKNSRETIVCRLWMVSENKV